ncbi:MAG: hypothetical protein QGH17_04885 [Candidatus Marinimicrobia bacterium]|jgi:hypothetical protein|nr:hypothetical protein [Candidatus Neomarinimicrobiota bacterium]MDP7529123.1 hypothetical protein [Candidatus Neomarinimicrobiota bacterium]
MIYMTPSMYGKLYNLHREFAVVELGSRRQAEWVETVVLAEPLR